MTGETAAATDRMKVFISYSRDDVSFADQLVLALRDRGFEPLLDRHDIDGAEQWRDRLGSLLLSCDAVVFVLTENSAGSPVCEWEVEEATRLGKRMLPVVPGEIDGVEPPIALAALNWIHFYSDGKLPGSGFYDGLQKLDHALRVDTNWLRQQTRLSERATEWSRQRNEDMLLRGLALNEAEIWLGHAPPGTPTPPLINEYLTASATTEARRNAEAKAQIFEREEALQRAERAVRDKEVAAARLQSTLADKVRVDRRMRSLSYFSLVLGLILAIGAAGAGWFLSNQQVASAERTSVLYANSANALSDEGNNAKAMLMSLSGDPLAQRGPVEKFFRPGGYYAGRAALERGYVSNRLVRAFDSGPDAVGSVVFSKDGALILVASHDGDARLFRTDTGAMIATLEGKETFGTTQAAFSADEKQVVVVGGNAEVTVWDIASRTVLKNATLESEFSGKVALSSDGAYLVTSGGQADMSLWNIAESRLVKAIHNGDGAVSALSFSPDGKFVLFGTTNGSGYAWSMETGSLAGAVSIGEMTGDRTVVSIAMSPDGKTVAMGIGAMSTFIGEVGVDGASRVISGGAYVPTELVFSPDGRRLLEIGSDGYARLWNASSGDMLCLFAVGDVGAQSRGGAAAFSPDGSQMLTGVEGASQLWRANTGETLVTLTENGGEVNSVAFSPDGSLALTGSADGNARLWATDTGKPAGPVLTGRGDPVNAVAFSPDGALALTGAGATDQNVRLWNAVTGARGNILSGLKQPALSVAFSSNGAQAAAGAKGGKVRIWTLNTQASVEFEAHKADINSIAFSRDGSRLLTASSDGTAKLWRISDKVLLSTYDVGETVWAAAFSPDERYVLTGSTGNMAILWGIGGGERIRTYRGHSNNVSSLAFSPDGSLILTGSMDGTATLWRTEQDYPTASLTGHTGAVRSVAFSPDGRKVMTGSLDGTARIWAVDPFLFRTPPEQQVLACERLAQLGARSFTAKDRIRFPILTIEPPRPCVTEWTAAVAPQPAPEKKAAAPRPSADLRPATVDQP